MEPNEFYNNTIYETAGTYDNALIIIHCNESDNADSILFGKSKDCDGLIYLLAYDLMKNSNVSFSAKAYVE